MANKEHLELLKRGLAQWNEWVGYSLSRRLDLSGADLRQMSFSGAHFSYTNFSHADLSETDLTDAYLIDAYLLNTDLRSANLQSANLSGAHLSRANLAHANLLRTRLGRADLSGADLTGAKLTYADLGGAQLGGAGLRGADVSGAGLRGADLSGADLSGADLSRADLRDANLSGADLSLAKLRNADLTRARLSTANLSGAVLTQAAVGGTYFVDLDLREVAGLADMKHYGPSEISVNTLDRSQGHIPEGFLRGCGLKNWEIEGAKLYQPALSRNQVVELTYEVIRLRSDPLIQFNSCFISYSSKDEKFTKQLYTDLQGSGVRCWFSPEDMKIGDHIRHRLDDSIQLHDKLLLILSEASVRSQWIEQEVETALGKERNLGCDVLFPVRLDNAVMNLKSGWPALIRNTRHIGDFCQWRNPVRYKETFIRLLDDLRVDA